MKCPRCGFETTRVTHTIQVESSNCTLRYRQCQRLECGYTFKTVESADNAPLLHVAMTLFNPN